MGKKKWKVVFSGFCYVEADSAEEAEDKARNEEDVYRELFYDDAEKVEEFEVSF